MCLLSCGGEHCVVVFVTAESWGCVCICVTYISMEYKCINMLVFIQVSQLSVSLPVQSCYCVYGLFLVIWSVAFVSVIMNVGTLCVLERDSTACLSAGQGSGCRGKECSFSVICCLSSIQWEKQKHLRRGEELGEVFLSGFVCVRDGKTGREEGVRRNENHVSWGKEECKRKWEERRKKIV